MESFTIIKTFIWTLYLSSIAIAGVHLEMYIRNHLKLKRLKQDHRFYLRSEERGVKYERDSE